MAAALSDQGAGGGTITVLRYQARSGVRTHWRHHRRVGRVITGAWLSDAACKRPGEDRFDVRKPADAWGDVDGSVRHHHSAFGQAVAVSQLEIITNLA